MTVVDASLVVAGLLDVGGDGEWALEVLADPAVVAPHLLPVEVTQVLRRLVAAGSVSADVAAIAHDDLADLGLPLY